MFFKDMKKVFIYFVAGISCLSGSLSAILPEEILPDQDNGRILPDGQFVRKGTVAATYANAREYNQLKSREEELEVREKIEKIIRDLNTLMPSIHSLGLLEFFSVEEWLLADHDKEGRLLVAAIYLQVYPQYANDKCIEKLKTLFEEDSSHCLKEQILLSFDKIETFKNN